MSVSPLDDIRYTNLYKPLNASKSEIRCLLLLPDEPAQSIRGTLEVVSLDDKPEYEALSYVWGDSNDQKTIMVSGHEVQVTTNLHTALSHFRFPDKPRRIWVDALCINQQDNIEKGTQITLMRRIYQQCSICQVWLGKELDFPQRLQLLADGEELPAALPNLVLRLQGVLKTVSEKEREAMRQLIKSNELRKITPVSSASSMDTTTQRDICGAILLIKALAEDYHCYQWPFFRITEYPNYELCPDFYVTWSDFMAISVRKWFSRIWTVQECMLPEKVTLNIGTHHVDFKTYLKAWSNLMKHIQNDECCPVGGESLRTLQWHTTRHPSSLYTPMMAMSTLAECVPLMTGPEPTKFGLRIHRLATKSRHSTDARDFIYGLHGLIPSLLGEGELPDYSASVAECFAVASKKCYSQIGDLSFLTESYQSCASAITEPGLPTWAIDYTVSAQSLQASLFFSACGPYVEYNVPAGNCSWASLPVEATFVTRITSMENMPRATLTTWPPPSSVFAWQSSHMDLIERDPKAFWRTMYGDRVLGDVPPLSTPEMCKLQERHFDLIHKHHTWLFETFLPVNHDEESPITYKDELSLTGRDDTFTFIEQHWFRCNDAYPYFITCDDGRIGRACGIPKKQNLIEANLLPEADDVVAILKGCRMPIILRSVEELPEVDPQTCVESAFAGWKYKSIGSCYVDDTMYGELITQDTVWQAIELV